MLLQPKNKVKELSTFKFFTKIKNWELLEKTKSSTYMKGYKIIDVKLFKFRC